MTAPTIYPIQQHALRDEVRIEDIKADPVVREYMRVHGCGPIEAWEAILASTQPRYLAVTYPKEMYCEDGGVKL